MELYQFLLTTVDRAGVVLMLFLIIYLLYTGKLRWGRDYDDLEKDRDRYKEIAELANQRNAEKLEQLEKEYLWRGRR